MKKTNLDLAVLIAEELIKKGLIPQESHSIKFDTENLVMDVLDKYFPHNREHM